MDKEDCQELNEPNVIEKVFQSVQSIFLSRETGKNKIESLDHVESKELKTQ